MTSTPLPKVRRLEAAGFRAWPSQQSLYDGAWLYRISPTQDGRRINSVTPLDPGDDKAVIERLSKAGGEFEKAGRPLIFRETPLMPQSVLDVFLADGWSAEGESYVQICALNALDLSEAKEQLPYRDVSGWAEQFIAIREQKPEQARPLAEAISGIEPDVGLFLTQDEASNPTATVMAVHDRDMVGVFEVAVAQSARRQGLARRLVMSALRWAVKRGAKTAWLQVEADNQAARGLYDSLGFETAYPYRYWRAP
ncbi:MAG: GNAT family N-acetyltransferase [Pseudomonadota bacterium]